MTWDVQLIISSADWVDERTHIKYRHILVAIQTMSENRLDQIRFYKTMFGLLKILRYNKSRLLIVMNYF